jgi:hypothetical protein
MASKQRLFDIFQYVTKAKINEANSHDLVIKRGSELYHGTIEQFEKEKAGTGGYDNVFWTTDSPAIAQTYIPTSSKLYVNSDMLAMPSSEKNIQNFQKSIGINYDYSQVEFQNRRVVSYKEAPVFEEYSNKEHELRYAAVRAYTKLNDFNKKYREMDKANQDIPDDFFDKYREAEDEYERLQAEEKKYNLKKYKNDYVNQHLQKLGYTPTDTNSDGNHSWKLHYDNNIIQPANYRAKGRLLIVTPKRDLRIYDNTLGGSTEGDLTDLEYHKLDLFRNAEKQGYDGIKINDFAQSNDWGNVGHTSIGLFKKTLKDLNFEETEAVHHDLSNVSKDWKTPEYKKFKGLA